MQLTRWMRLGALSAAALAGILAGPRTVSAQGVTTGAVTGTVLDKEGKPVENVTIVVTNPANGARTGAQTRANGRYYIGGLEVGGYSVTARLIGYKSETREGVRVSLNAAARVDFSIERAAATLAAVVTTASAADREFTPTRQGSQTLVSDTLIARLPTLNRSLSDFVRLTPNVNVAEGGRISAAGQNNRFTNFQVDGVTAANRFGLGNSQELGAQAGGRSISLDAIKEVQVLVSPYDVRQGNFTGALVNAVTKSGTNQLKGSVFYTTRTEEMARNDPFIRSRDFLQNMFGASLGGAIVKDRVHFFALTELQQQRFPASGPYLGQPATVTPAWRIGQPQLDSINAAASTFGIQPGTAGLVTNQNPLINTFARLDIKLSDKHRMVLRNTWNLAEQDDFSRSNAANNPVIALGSLGFLRRDVSNNGVVQLFSNWGNKQNELMIGATRTRFRRVTPQEVPMVTIQNVGGANNAQVRFGTENSSQRNELDEDGIEIRNDFTFTFGTHTMTIGGRGELYSVRNSFLQNSFGNYTFDSIAQFVRGVPTLYSGSGGLGGDVIARFQQMQAAVYWQDLWQPSSRFSMTFGLRADAPFFLDNPSYTARFERDFGRRTDVMPAANWQLSPRLGFNWQVDQNAALQLRGGIGVFQGLPMGVWMSNQYQNNGSGLAQFTCGPGNLSGSAPTFVPNAAAQPNGCGPLAGFTGANAFRNGQPGLSLASGTLVGTVNLASSDLRNPTVWRATLAADRRLWGGVIGTIEGMYSQGINDLFYLNINLPTNPVGVDRNGRQMYAPIGTNGQRQTVLRNAAYGPILDIVNQNVNYAWNITTGLRKAWGRAFEGAFNYTYGRSFSASDLGSSVALSNWQFGRVYSGRQESYGREVSDFDQPHRLVLSGTYTAPWKRFETNVSFFFQSQSGRPFSYVTGGAGGRGDLNGDGSNANDPVYIPRNATDVNEMEFAPLPVGSGATAVIISPTQQAQAYEQFISDLPCMNAQRGQIMRRNSCRNPDFQTMDVTIGQNLGSIGGHRLKLDLQIYNFLNFLNKDWGKIRTAGPNSNVTAVQHVDNIAGTGTGAAAIATSKPRFTFDPTQVDYNVRFARLQNAFQFYQIQAAIRYSF